MKITPLEIRQKSFERNLRGYDKDDVHAFLNSLSQEWERTLDELKELRMRLENSEREVSKLREVETTLYKTLKTAEDTGASVVEQANKKAELHLREAQLQADTLLSDARNTARQTTEEAERRAQQMLGEVEQRFRELIQQYRAAIQHRDSLAGDLGRIAQELADRSERLRRFDEGFQPEVLLSGIRQESRTKAPEPLPTAKPMETQAAPATVPNPPKSESKAANEGSFFDQIS